MSISKMICTCSCVLLLTSGCSTEKSNEWFMTHNGNMPSNERISKVSVGDSRADVRRVLGAPSTVVSFDKNTWIYMSSDIKRVAFFSPDEVNRDVLTIKFNDNDEVKEIIRMSKNDGQDVRINDDETEAYGQEPGFFRKYFGGVGMINPFGGRGSSSNM